MNSLFKCRLLWMFENQPALVKELADRRECEELENLIWTEMYRAQQFADRLVQEGMSWIEAREESIRAILAPGREWGEDAPRPLSDQDQETVIRLLELREEQEERREKAEERRSKKQARMARKSSA